MITLQRWEYISDYYDQYIPLEPEFYTPWLQRDKGDQSSRRNEALKSEEIWEKMILFPNQIQEDYHKC